ncbi:MAG TPA: hypothetical protein PLT28_12965 [Saprospiraceae bacterium]|jgi:outer membrane receptor for ferrienterochelin and colicins|nr:hypothetical protein [Saprospiraceae bacterium]
MQKYKLFGEVSGLPFFLLWQPCQYHLLALILSIFWFYRTAIDFNKNIGGVYTSLLVEAFYTKLENPFQNIVGDMDDNGVVTYTRTNAKKGAKVTGVNIEFKLFPTKKLSFNSGFTIQSSKYDEIQADNFNKKDFYRTPDSYGFFTVD